MHVPLFGANGSSVRSVANIKILMDINFKILNILMIVNDIHFNF